MDCLSVWMDEEGWTEEAARREKGGGGLRSLPSCEGGREEGPGRRAVLCPRGEWRCCVPILGSDKGAWVVAGAVKAIKP